MTNKSVELFRAFMRKGMAKDEAFFAVLDHFQQLWLHDRDRYAEQIRELKSCLSKLETAEYPE